MLKYHVTCNNTDNPFYSSSIIVNGLNEGAKKLGLYDENGPNIHYSHLCESHGKERQAFISLYELDFHPLILQNANGKPIIGSSRDNLAFILNSGYPSNKASFVVFGVDKDIWKIQEKRFYKDKFVFLSFMEENTRSGLVQLVDVFCKTFQNTKGVVLFIKGRNATDTFKSYVKEIAAKYNVEIIHKDDNIENWQGQLDIYASADCHIFLNHSSTFALTIVQSLSCGIPTATMYYSGPRETCHSFNSIEIKYNLAPVTREKLERLESFGLKNHLFKEGYRSTPCWAEADNNALSELMIKIVDNKNNLDYYRQRGRQTAEYFSWSRAALNMSFELERLLK